MAVVVAPTQKQIKQGYDDYALALGSVVHASNRFQETLSQLFAALMGGDSRKVYSVWHAILSDRTQLDMLQAALNGCSEHVWEKRLPDARKDLIWLLVKSRVIANSRNDAVHAPSIYLADGTVSEVVPLNWTKNQRALNLRNKRLIKEFDFYEKTYEELNWFAFKAARSIAHNAEPWPKRPTLPTRDHTHYRVPPRQ